METGTLTQKIEDYAGIAQGETLPHHLWARTLYRKTLQKMSDTEVDELCLAIGDKDFLSVLTSSLSGERSCFNCPMPISIDTKKKWQRNIKDNKKTYKQFSDKNQN